MSLAGDTSHFCSTTSCALMFDRSGKPLNLDRLVNTGVSAWQKASTNLCCRAKTREAPGIRTGLTAYQSDLVRWRRMDQQDSVFLGDTEHRNPINGEALMRKSYGDTEADSWGGPDGLEGRRYAKTLNPSGSLCSELGSSDLI